MKSSVSISRIPGKAASVTVDPAMSIRSAIESAGITLKPDDVVVVDGQQVSVDQPCGTPETVFVVNSIRGELPTPRIKKVKRWLEQKGYHEVRGAGKGDHSKYKDSNGNTVVLNPGKNDKKCLDLGSAKSLARALGMSYEQVLAKFS